MFIFAQKYLIFKKNSKAMQDNTNKDFVTVLKNLFAILVIMSVTFVGISFISQAPELTNRFFVYVIVFIIVVELIALFIWRIVKLFKRKSIN
jgi:hypothetical protein